MSDNTEEDTSSPEDKKVRWAYDARRNVRPGSLIYDNVNSWMKNIWLVISVIEGSPDSLDFLVLDCKGRLLEISLTTWDTVIEPCALIV